MFDEVLANAGTVLGLGVAVVLVAPWVRGLGIWGVTVGVAALAGTGVWWEMGMNLPGAIAGAGAFGLAGLCLWPQVDRANRNHHRQFTQMVTELLTGQRAWERATLTQLFRLAPPEELPRLRATVRYMAEQHPELRSLLTPFLEDA
ncbi:MAG: hypothetical protein Q6K90_04500 [Gloeomargarita sp. HHBFW_bins_162]